MRLYVIAAVALMFALKIGCHNKEMRNSVMQKYSSSVPRCMGRNIIYLPDVFLAADVVDGYFKPVLIDENISSFDVVVKGNGIAPTEFAKYVSRRRAELKDNSSATSDVLRLENKLSDVATLFRIQRVEDAYISEINSLLSGSIVTIKIKSYENTFIDAETRLSKFISNIVAADQKEFNGFCLGTLSISGDFSQESGSYYWRDDAGNTFAIEIDTFNSEDPKNLLQRMAGPDSLLSLFNIGHTVLRSRERTVAGMRAYEWLGWTNLGADGDKKTFKFVLETTRPQGGRTTPRITVTFDSAKQRDDGTETTTNLSDAEAMALWDKVVNSIQPAK
jgi:hypothetical protein